MAKVMHSPPPPPHSRRMAEMAYYICELDMVVGGDGPGLSSSSMQLLQSCLLLPGDIVVVTTGKVAQDMILLDGECVADETVLTGVGG